MSRRFNVACSLGAAVLLTQCVVAHATLTPIETVPFNLNTPAFGFTVVDGNLAGATNDGPKTTSAPVTFHQFNTGLGTLLGVEVTFSSTFGSVITVGISFTPESGELDQETFTSNGSQQLTLTGPAGLNESSSLSPTTSCMILTMDAHTCSQSATVGPSTFDSGAPIVLLPLGSFQGPGMFDLTVTLNSSITPAITQSASHTADNSTMTGTLATNWQGSVSVRFEYQESSTEAVSGPMTLYLMLAGGAGIALLRRRVPVVRAIASALARTSANRR